ncbi:hypothetical protein NPIL_684341 [Nephila pilipes]|uniref:Uncharacterized protein n=1 Tax=Nephila pilipes TaxID=299642 RepID=A0A8X6TPI5_NEPPI|nr:hypothetical protein NPIL_684341 [Nephila pilipes]
MQGKGKKRDKILFPSSPCYEINHQSNGWIFFLNTVRETLLGCGNASARDISSVAVYAPLSRKINHLHGFAVITVYNASCESPVLAYLWERIYFVVFLLSGRGLKGRNMWTERKKYLTSDVLPNACIIRKWSSVSTALMELLSISGSYHIEWLKREYLRSFLKMIANLM